MEKKATYIVFEGMDGSGKTTQSKLLKEFLESQGYSVFLFSEPTDNELGRLIKRKIVKKKNYSPETLALCFAADRSIFKDETLLKALEEYEFVIGDRSFFSSLVYQPLMGLDYFWVKELNRFVVKPDITFILDISVEEFMRRRGETDVIFEKKEFQEKLRKAYLQLPEKFPKDLFFIINGERKIEEIHEEIKKKVLLYSS